MRLREANAKAALRSTASEIGRKLAELIDPRIQVQEHPWKSSGIAALAGFFVGFKVAAPSEAGTESGTAEPSGPSPWATLTSTLIETGSGAVKAALLPWLAQKLQDLMPKGEAPAEASPPFEKGGPGGI